MKGCILNMRKFQLISDSSCDTPRELLEKYQIHTIPFYVSFDETIYEKEIEEISLEKFYSRLTTEKVFPKTSLPSVQDYIDTFTPYLKQGLDILCLNLSKKFSGSYQSARTAKDILLEDFPNANIYILDSYQATAGQGLTLMQAAKMMEAGLTLEETVIQLEQLRLTSRIMFTVGTLEYLQKGGRVGKAASLAGTILNLKPMIVLENGELFPKGTVRGRKKSLERVISMTREYFESIGEKFDHYDFCLATGTCAEETQQLQRMLEELIERKIEYPLFPIGVTIGTHTGPDALGVVFIKKWDVE